MQARYSMGKSFILSFLLLLAASACFAVRQPVSLTLDNNWKFRMADSGNWLPAKVPGCVHTDLLNARRIDEPFFGTNENKLQWIDKKDWEYETRFKLDPSILKHDHLELIFEGLDTYAEVRLNGTLILKADNMFRSWKVDCIKWLKADNILTIRFLSPIAVGLEKLDANGYALPNDNDDSKMGGLGDKKVSVFTRKAQFQYGWDWGPRFVTCGIWRPVKLLAWDELQISDLFVRDKVVNEKSAQLKANIEILSSIESQSTITLFADDKSLLSKKVPVKPGLNKFSFDFTIENPELWWSNGIGKQKLYNIKAEILNGEEKDEMAVLHGIRTLKLIQKPDEKGKSFYFELNGVPVFAKGANYIPADIFLTRATPEDYERIVKDAAAANMNMLRVWGGGIYENDIFYDLCDKYGILIWQDFMFACSLYPGDSAFMENVRLEAIDNVKRLRNHPCMALWCGNNECEAAWKDWGYEKKFKEKDPKLAEKVWNDYCKLFHRLLYGVVQEYQPDIAYWASSPMASWTPGMNDDKVARKTDNSGDRHYWDVWHGRQPFSKYAELIPRFMSEYGLQSFPGFRTVKTFAPSPSDWSIESEIMMHHQKNGRGNMLIRQYMQDWYQIPPRFEHFLYVSQLLQAEGIKVGMEALRRNMPYCMGSLYWQLNDCWPVASWSGIDSYHNWKALHYYAAKAYNPELVSPYIVNDSLQVHVVSDRLTAFTAEIELQVLDMKGSIILLKNYSKDISPNSSMRICNLPVSELLNGKSGQEVFVLLRLRENQKVLSENSCYFVPFKDLKLQKPVITHSFIQNENGGVIKLTSNVLAKNVFLDSEIEGLKYSDNFFDLFPGQAIEIRVTAPKGTSLKENQLSILSLFDTYTAN